MSSKEEIKLLIASAIKVADDSYIFEDYLKQASSVLRQLKANGYLIAPIEALPQMIKDGKDAIPYGTTRPEKLVG